MMRMSLVTDILGYLPFENMLDTVAQLGTTGYGRLLLSASSRSRSDAWALASR